jgi:hypothetical protein
MLQELNDTIHLFTNDVEFLPAMAKLHRTYFECLLAEGFTEDQALVMVSQLKITQ